MSDASQQDIDGIFNALRTALDDTKREEIVSEIGKTPLESSDVESLRPIEDLGDIQAQFRPFESGLYDDLVQPNHDLTDDKYNIVAYDALLSRGIDYLTRALSIRDDGIEYSLRYMNDFLERIEGYNAIKASNIELAEKGPFQLTIEAEEAMGSLASSPETDTNLNNLEKLTQQRNLAEANRALKRAESLKRQFEEAKKRLAERYSIALARNLQAQSSGGALNYVERISSLRDAYAENIREAYSLLRAAHNGLKLVYPGLFRSGSSAPKYDVFPEFVQPVRNLEIGYSDDLLEWARHVSHSLNRYYGRAQEVVVLWPVAHDAFSENSKQYTNLEALKKGETIKFNIDEDGFEPVKEGLSGLSDLQVQSVDVLWVGYEGHLSTAGRRNLELTNTVRSGWVRPPIFTTDQGPVAAPTHYFSDAAAINTSLETPVLEQSIRNCSFVGDWQLKLGPINYDPYNGGEPNSLARPVAIFLKAVLRGIPIRNS